MQELQIEAIILFTTTFLSNHIPLKTLHKHYSEITCLLQVNERNSQISNMYITIILDLSCQMCGLGTRRSNSAHWKLQESLIRKDGVNPSPKAKQTHRTSSETTQTQPVLSCFLWAVTESRVQREIGKLFRSLEVKIWKSQSPSVTQNHRKALIQGSENLVWRKVRTKILNWNLHPTGSQCKSFKNRVICKDLWQLVSSPVMIVYCCYDNRNSKNIHQNVRNACRHISVNPDLLLQAWTFKHLDNLIHKSPHPKSSSHEWWVASRMDSFEMSPSNHHVSQLA